MEILDGCPNSDHCDWKGYNTSNVEIKWIYEWTDKFIWINYRNQFSNVKTPFSSFAMEISLYYV